MNRPPIKRSNDLGSDACAAAVRWNRRRFLAISAAAGVAYAANGHGRQIADAAHPGRDVYVVPTFHPASCGWLTTFSRERVYCVNSYLDHLDRVRDDPQYAFVMSEVNNFVAIMNFKPERVPEIQQRLREGRVEVVNAFYLESTINLSGGEALVRMGCEGLDWFERVLGARPRFAWCIDTCGVHEQMAQIVSGLGLEALIYTRENPTGQTIFWTESPDGSRVLTLCPGSYHEARSIFDHPRPFDERDLRALEDEFAAKEAITPAGAPLLLLGGGADYSIARAIRARCCGNGARRATRDGYSSRPSRNMSMRFDRLSTMARSRCVHRPVAPPTTTTPSGSRTRK